MNGPEQGRGATGVPDAADLARKLDGLDLDGMLTTVAESFQPGRIAILSAFGPASLVLIHQMSELGLRLPVIFIDTLHHFPETLELVDRVDERYGLDLRVYRACASRAEFEEKYGKELWKRDLDRYQELSKVEPYRRAIAELDGWITGRRREQSEGRAELTLVEDGPKLRINPLAGWTRTDVWRFILDRGIPYNPLHDQGYASIGDEPLTTAVATDEDERAGRWRGLGRSECGIHLAPLEP